MAAKKKKERIYTLEGLWQVAMATKHVTGLSKYRQPSRGCAERRAGDRFAEK